MQIILVRLGKTAKTIVFILDGKKPSDDFNCFSVNKLESIWYGLPAIVCEQKAPV